MNVKKKNINKKFVAVRNTQRTHHMVIIKKTIN